MLAALMATLASCGKQAADPPPSATLAPPTITGVEPTLLEPSGIANALQESANIPLSSDKPTSTPEGNIPDGEALLSPIWM